MKLRSVSLSYDFTSLLKKHQKFIKGLTATVTGTNLFCLTNYSGYDPEVDTRRKTPLTPGVDCSAYPKSVGYVVGVNVTF